MDKKLIFDLIGGLGMFLFGMKIMSEGLQKISGDRIRKILESLTSNRLMGLIVGVVITGIIQSSSAVTVMVVGFVNAGLMSLIQSIGVILGANIGTTVTAQMIAFKVHKFALPILGIGVFIKLFAKKKMWAYYGEVMLGFGLLFFGLTIMKNTFAPLEHNEAFKMFFAQFSSNPWLAVLAGIALTFLIQSSSATIAITMGLAASGLLKFDAAVAMVLGENIGTTITANLASIGTNVNAKRTARAHMLFNTIGTIYILLLLKPFLAFIENITPGVADFVATTPEAIEKSGLKPHIGRHIANAHTVFNLINVAVFLPFTGLLAKAATFLVPAKEGEEEEYSLVYLNTNLLNTPVLAINEARKEVERMAQTVAKMYNNAVDFIFTKDMKLYKKVIKREDSVDLFQKDITNFLVEISQQSITKDISREIASLMNMVNNLERVGDHCENLAKLGEKIIDNKIKISGTARTELEDISTIAGDFIKSAVKEIPIPNKSYLQSAKFFEQRVNNLEDTYRERHIQRLNDGSCKVSAGLIYVDMLTNFEKIGDHMYNISEAIAGRK